MFSGMEHLCADLHDRGPAQPAGAAPATALGRPAAGRLNGCALARIAAAVPRTLVPATTARANAIVVQFLLDAGAVRASDIPAQWSDEVDVCRHALTNWLRREIGPLNCLSPAFWMQPVCAEQYQPPRPAEAPQLQVVWQQEREQQWVVGPRLEQLESAVPHLGATVLNILDRRSALGFPVFTPRDARGAASHLYWYGEDDETLVLDEQCGNDEEAKAAMRDDMVTTSDFTDAFPEWALTWKPQLLPTKKLRGLATSHVDPYVREIAALARELAALRLTDAFRPDIEGEFIGFGAVLAWREDDLAVRVYDDLLNFAHQGEFCDRIGEACFDLRDPTRFRAWQRQMRSRFKAIRLIDRLIQRLAE